MTISEPLTSLATILLAVALSAGITWLIRPLLRRYALARPNARSSHRMPTPQGAGIAVIAATLAIAGLAAVLMGFALPLVLFGATVFIALVGMLDDIRPIPVLPRLLLQAAAVGAVVYAVPGDLRIAPALPLALERGLLLLAGLWFVNLVNFMDGLDLMTVAEVVPATGALILLSWLDHFQGLPALVAMALCGAMLGFAPYNRPVARVFLGDVGSLPIGLLLGWCLLHLASHQHLIAALLLPLYYLADATLTLSRRVARREPFWAAHRSHFYQQATDNGFGVSQVVGEVFALNVVLAALAVASVTSSAEVAVASLFSGAVAVALVLFHFSRKRPARAATRDDALSR
jgi:UDP-N-acetylmuramyl pentapeptide phosphotransferase/UDP-N-acetylglucosamine-1-phosphate transferase